MKRTYVLLVFCVAFIAVAAQRLVADAPSVVAVGEQFRLTYTINTQNVNGFRSGTIPEYLEVLMGPSTSSQSSFQMVNGHTSSTSSITYTYIICANKKGVYTIPSARINVGSKTVVSNQLKIRVTGSSRANSKGRASSSGDEIRQTGNRISGSDLFIKVSANKRRVYEQEPILLTYKVYTLVDLTSLNGKMPDLKGFHTQEVQLPQQKSYKIETFKGRPYRTVTWSQYVMFPQITGKLEIPSITFDGIVCIQNRDVDPFEAFFNGGSGYVEVKKKIIAPGLTIQVDPLPSRPVGFSGGVGKFTISAKLSKTDIKANNPVTLRVVISGHGNLKLIKYPEIRFPKDFDTYDVKVTDKTKLSGNGVEGNMIYDFLAVPRHQGRYEIPQIKFVYYDTDAKSYITLQTQPFVLNVEKGSGSSTVDDYTSQDNIDQLNKDIRYIKLGNADRYERDKFFFGSLAYFLFIGLLCVLFICMFIVFRRRNIENSNTGILRSKKANKVATKRLQKAEYLLLVGKTSLFYDEVLRALWGYVGDKLNISVEKLSRDNICQCLSDRNVDDDTISLFMRALDECEYERYAPGDVKGNMNKTFEAAMTAIMRIEENMRKRGAISNARPFVMLIILMWLPMLSFAVTKANADSAYANQQYQQAIKDYEELLKEGESSELYYNLGNAYYRVDNITMAVLNYERALLLSPGDGDIRYNLQMARSKTIDKITPESEMFFVIWYRALVNFTSVDRWAYVAIVAFCFVIIGVLLYLFSTRIFVRKMGFYGGAIFFIAFILANIFAYQQKENLINRNGAIVISSVAPVKSTPSKNGSDLFILHEGTKVSITDGSIKGWKEIRVADGKEGWVDASCIEII